MSCTLHNTSVLHIDTQYGHAIGSPSVRGTACKILPSENKENVTLPIRCQATPPFDGKSMSYYIG